MARVKVIYADGREESVSMRPMGLVAAERHYKGDVPPFEGTCYAVWALLRPGPVFEEWLDSLEDVEQEESTPEVPPSEPPPPAE